jgi:hypothetical protein
MIPFDNPPIEATVTIQRPVAAVFGFYRDFTNLPRFLGDVMAVDVIDATTTRWTIQGPFGRRNGTQRGHGASQGASGLQRGAAPPGAPQHDPSVGELPGRDGRDGCDVPRQGRAACGS